MRVGNPTARVTPVEGSKIAWVYKKNLTDTGTTLNDLGNRTRLETSKKLSQVAELSLKERLQGR